MTPISDSFSNLPFYFSYLVRIWRDTPSTPWRASARSVQSGETVRFSTLEALYEFLDAQTVADRYAQSPAANEAPFDS
ncbi:MAG: hypothetical protein R3A44_00105 [Caldilineaceae bacterium]